MVSKRELKGSKILGGLDRVAANRKGGFEEIEKRGIGHVGKLCPHCGFSTMNSHNHCTNCSYQRVH